MSVDIRHIEWIENLSLDEKIEFIKDNNLTVTVNSIVKQGAVGDFFFPDKSTHKFTINVNDVLKELITKTQGE